MQLGQWWTVLLNLATAHSRAYDALHELDDGDADGDGIAVRVSLAKNLNTGRPERPWSVVDPLAAGGGLWGGINKLFLTLLGGERKLDFLGISHYFRLTFRNVHHSFRAPESSLAEAVCEASGW